MSRNVVSVEFRAVGDGLDRIENALKGVRENARGLENAGASLDRVSSGAAGATRGVASLASAVGVLPGAVSPAVSGFTQLGTSLAGVSAVVPVVGVALAASAVSIGLVTAAAKGLVDTVVSVAQETIPKAEELRRAFLGLESVAKFKGIDPAAARASVEGLDLVKNGLLTVGQASTALKNLLASGFGLEQSVEIVKRFGDAAAFGKQEALTFGQAVVSGTEGIKNRNSILVDNVGVTKNLSIILKEAGFELQDLDDKTKSAAASQALYEGLLRETAAQQGNAAKLAEGYAGSIAKIDVGYTKIQEKVGAVIRDNKALGSTLELVGQAVDLVNRDFDGLVALFGLLVPVIQLATAVLVPFAEGLGGLTASAGLAIQAIAALRAINGVGTATENASLNKLGEDLKTLGLKAAGAAATLPRDIAAIKQAAKSEPAERTFVDDINDALGKLNPARFVLNGLDLLRQMTVEVDRRAKLEADAGARQVEAFSRSLDLERQRQALAAQTALLASAPGRNPLAVQFDQASQKLTADADKRLADELDRLGKERTKLLDQIGTEQGKKSPDSALITRLRSSLKDLDDAAVTFTEIARATTEAERQALSVDFVNKFADQMQQANRTLFDVTRQLNDDNPFVAIFSSGDEAVSSFRRTFGDATAELLEFQARIDQLTTKQADRARAAQSLQIFGLQQRQTAFGAQAGILPSQSAEDVNRAIFEQFDRLKANGEEGLKAANKFLTDAASAGQIDVSLLLPSQANEVFQAFTDLQNQIAFQEQEAKELERARVAREEGIEKARIDALTAATEATTANSKGLTALSNALGLLLKNGIVKVEITAEAGTTIIDAAVAGSATFANT